MTAGHGEPHPDPDAHTDDTVIGSRRAAPTNTPPENPPPTTTAPENTPPDGTALDRTVIGRRRRAARPEPADGDAAEAGDGENGGARHPLRGRTAYSPDARTLSEPYAPRDPGGAAGAGPGRGPSRV